MVYRRDDQIFGGGIGWMGQTALPAPKVLGLESQGNIVLAVTTGGLDVDPTRPVRIVSGDWSAKPFATIQAAIDALPKIGFSGGGLPMTINVGAGSFAGFDIRNFVGTIRINGTRQLSVIASGPNTGTATSGASQTITLTGAGWTPDDLVGRFINVTAGPGAGNIVPIAKNTIDTLTFSKPIGAGTSTVFQIEDVTTVITSGGPIVPSSRVFITNCAAAVALYDLVSVGATGYGFCVYASNGATLRRCVVNNGDDEFVGTHGPLNCFCCVARAATGGGFAVQNCRLAAFDGCLALNCGGVGFNLLYGIPWAYLSSGNYARNCVSGFQAFDVALLDAAGIVADSCNIGIEAYYSKLQLIYTTLQNIGGQPIILNFSHAYIAGSLDGSGNAGWGLNAHGSGNVVELAGITPTITGALGEVTVDGTTDVTWAALSASGDYALDATTGARINRQ